MGPLKNVFGMMGAPDVPKELVEQGGEKLNKYRIIISSMTKAERNDEKLLHQPGKGSEDSEGQRHQREGRACACV